MTPINALVPDLLDRYGVSSIPLYRSSNVETVRALVARGLGYSVMAIPPLDPGAGGDPTVAIPISSDYPRGHMVLATRDAAHVTARTRAIVEQCRRIFADWL
ncbi:LysR substrate-binding domain-containing protein [Microbacterium suwonense]|uniref:LysR substrate-binding domain-containing protein n=1 Tax=Microbacterium suwonense TaxID=683047 RepID=A0ABM8FWG1_9MICO|nr:LysR substrate-binding domain-containing protein [Microbacterium suwonense]BDZ40054.1 hypothetical protein GCM10025863_26680 [Microbacterium suwonense]